MSAESEMKPWRNQGSQSQEKSTLKPIPQVINSSQPQRAVDAYTTLPQGQNSSHGESPSSFQKELLAIFILPALSMLFALNTLRPHNSSLKPSSFSSFYQTVQPFKTPAVQESRGSQLVHAASNDTPRIDESKKIVDADKASVRSEPISSEKNSPQPPPVAKDVPSVLSAPGVDARVMPSAVGLKESSAVVPLAAKMPKLTTTLSWFAPSPAKPGTVILYRDSKAHQPPPPVFQAPDPSSPLPQQNASCPACSDPVVPGRPGHASGPGITGPHPVSLAMLPCSKPGDYRFLLTNEDSVTMRDIVWHGTNWRSWEVWKIPMLKPGQSTVIQSKILLTYGNGNFNY